MSLYRILLVLDGIAAGIILFFFLWGLADGTVSASNILLWVGLIGAVAVPIVGGRMLKEKGQIAGANVLLAIPGVPAMLFGLFFLAVIVLQPRWN